MSIIQTVRESWYFGGTPGILAVLCPVKKEKIKDGFLLARR